MSASTITMLFGSPLAFRHQFRVTPSVARESMRSVRLRRLGRNLIVRSADAD